SLRLDPNVAPTFEGITLQVDADQPDYTGSVHIELQVKKTTNAFKFHAAGMTLRSVVLTGDRGVVRFSYRAGQTGLILVTTESPLTPGRYTLDIEFSNPFNTQAVSLYRVETGGQAYAFTQFEAQDARKAFPCWDEPIFKIPYQVTLTVPEGHLAIANTPIQQETIAGGRKTIVFARTKPLPSYLLAMATGPLETVPIPGLSIPGRVVTVKGQANRAAEAARVTPPILKALETYFGRPYPYEKLDIIGVPEYQFGAMENPGAITFLDHLLLFDSATASADQRRTLASILAHELAHIWFGDLVTMAWWDDVWLNESFASWLGDKITDQVFPQYRIALTQVRDGQLAMLTDAKVSTRAIRQPVTAGDNPEQFFDELAYQKGQAVLGMLEHWMGPEKFRRGILDYLKAHEWRNAAASDLWAALSTVAGRDIGSSMSTFLDQPGVPLVSAELLPDGSVRLSQQRFLNYGIQAPRPALWEIPVVLKYPDGAATRTQEVLLTQPVQTFVLRAQKPPAWIHPNAGEKGYYRWTVPPTMLLSLVQHSVEVLDVRERMGLVNNLAALLDAGQIKGDDYLRTIGAFADDSQPEVLSVLADDGLGKIWSNFVAESSGLNDAFAAYVRKTLSPALTRFGLAKKNGEAETVSLFRPSLMLWLGDQGQDARVLGYADSLAQVYVREPSAIDPALAEVALQLSSLRGDSTLFEGYRTKFETTTIPIERRQYLRALGYFRAPNLVERALQYTLSGPLRPQELLTIPNFINFISPQYRDRVFEWMTANYQTITSRIPPGFAALNLPWLANGCSVTRLDTARRFFANPSHAPPGTEKEVEKMAETVMRRVTLREREGRAVAKALSPFARP
ncbi:MAG: ERAP1-like C-terminal domain-containing protein, partial [Candidatus Latescibacteria bacterium]|nr:ERAP1-like C-terminal domain-containing protein [Candidatus Latescibacterota bacterium]